MILAADIGGTKTLVALFDEGVRTPRYESLLQSGTFDNFDALLEVFLAGAAHAFGARPGIDRACLGVAGPVEAGRARLTNLPWDIDAARIARRLGLGTVLLVNDFVAAAWGIDMLGEEGLLTLQRGEPLPGAPRLVIGAGTGLGVAYLTHTPQGYRPVPGEGGHGGFAPRDAEQLELWRWLQRQYDRVELEHVVSGAGLVRIHSFLAERNGLAIERDQTPAAVTESALEHRDFTALAALDLFLRCYGAATGDHALNVMARGGVYIAGGIAARMPQTIADSAFVAAFNDKGTFSTHLQRMPVHVVTEPRLGLIGAARAAQRESPA